MAVAKCGQRWSWDSPMWCSGKIMKAKRMKRLIKCAMGAHGGMATIKIMINTRKEE